MIAKFIQHKNPEPTNSSHTRGLFSNRNFIITLSVFSALALVQFSYRILIALWVKVGYDEKGLGWETEENPGFMNGASGVFVTLLPLFCTPMLSSKFGIKKTCILLACGMIPVIFAISWSYLLTGAAQWIYVIFMNGCCVAFSTVFVSFISMGISNSVSSKVVGAAMGIAQSTVSLMRAIGSAGGALIFGWSLGWNLNFPLNSQFIFVLLDVVLVCTGVVVWRLLDGSIEKRAKTTEEIPLIDKEKGN